MIPLPKDFREFLQFFHQRSVEYLLIGGWAVGYYGYPRGTTDIDVWIAVSPDNSQRVFDALEDFGFGASAGATPETFQTPGAMIRMGNSPIRIEILTRISGVEFAECYARRIVTELDGVPVNVISLPDLKANKLASGRLKDLNDLQNLS